MTRRSGRLAIWRSSVVFHSPVCWRIIFRPSSLRKNGTRWQSNGRFAVSIEAFPSEPEESPDGVAKISMSAEFVDTNVLVYAHDNSAGSKREIARDLLKRLWQERTGRLSVQVLLEFFWTVTRKVAEPLSPQKAAEIVDDLAGWDVYSPGPAEVMQAIRWATRHRLNIWDAMIVTAAIESGAETLWTEDLQDGRRFETAIVRNPFKSEGEVGSQ